MKLGGGQNHPGARWEPRLDAASVQGMEPAEVLACLEPVGCTQLLEHLSASRSERADTIQRYWSQPGARDIAENLILLEIDDHTRGVVLCLLRGQQEPAVG